jgi:hypothetical protein
MGMEQYTVSQGTLLTLTHTAPTTPSGQLSILTAQLTLLPFHYNDTEMTQPIFSPYNIGATGLPDTKPPVGGLNDTYDSALMLANSITSFSNHQNFQSSRDFTTGVSIPLQGFKLTDKVATFYIQYDASATTNMSFAFRICVLAEGAPRNQLLPVLMELGTADSDVITNWGATLLCDQYTGTSKATALDLNPIGGSQQTSIPWTNPTN